MGKTERLQGSAWTLRYIAGGSTPSPDTRYNIFEDSWGERNKRLSGKLGGLRNLMGTHNLP